jgi:hypothetical protein
MRLRRLLLLALAVAAVIGLSRRRESEYAEVLYDDGSSLRFGRGPEARDLLRDTEELLEIVA